MKVIERVLQPDNLRLAWEEVAERRGAPGRDQVSIQRWRRNWEERIIELARMVRGQIYRPQRPRIVHIPKRDGSLRQISILSVTDRVLQRAVLRVVDDEFERTFLDCSYGYRAGRGLRDAVPAILTHRDQGRSWVVDADIDACFDSLPHALILDQFQQVVADPAVLRLLTLWLKIGRRSIGISMGGVISPLLCNLCLNILDQRLLAEGYACIRYADDFCLFCESEEKAQAGLAFTAQILAELQLRLEPFKTRLTSFENGFDFLGIHFEGKTYSFICNQKKVEVMGAFDDSLFYDFVPNGYEE